MKNTKSAFIAIIGRPNVGKSSLINKILPHKIAAVSSKPQTTRTRIMGVLTRDENFKTKYEDVIICHNVEELLRTLVCPWSGCAHFPGKKNFLIGGAEIIKELFPYCTEAYITYINYPYPDPDTFFPIPIDTLDEWKLLSEERGKNCDNCGVDYFFRKYKKFNSNLFAFENEDSDIET